MFDFNEISKKQTDKIMKKWNVETDPIYTTGFKKVFKFLGYKLFPFIMNVASFIILIRIFGMIKNSSGIEGVVILGFVIIIFTLRGLTTEIGKLTS